MKILEYFIAGIIGSICLLPCCSLIICCAGFVIGCYSFHNFMKPNKSTIRSQ